MRRSSTHRNRRDKPLLRSRSHPEAAMGGRRNRGYRSQGSKTQPLSPPPAFAGLLLTLLTLDTPPRPGLHLVLLNFATAPGLFLLGVSFSQEEDLTSPVGLRREAARRPRPQCPAAAQGPPPPRGLCGATS